MEQQLEAGRELDKLVAERVMGTTAIRMVTVIDHRGSTSEWGTTRDYERNGVKLCEANALPKYSTDIAAAWEVVERALDYVAATTDFDRETNQPNKHRWELWFGERGRSSSGVGFGETAPLAICRAALLALGVVKSEDHARRRIRPAKTRG